MRRHIAQYYRSDAVTWKDSFCGGGGSSEGLRQSGGDIRWALNHDTDSLRTHEHNHPSTKHELQNLREADWTKYESTMAAWFSPSCVYFTHARNGNGSKKTTAEEERQLKSKGSVDRATATAVVNAAEIHRYQVVIVENVPEFQSWPLFDWWEDGMVRQGYTPNHYVLNAADVGGDPVAQDRPRYIGVFTQPGITVDMSLPPTTRKPAAAILDPRWGLGKPLTRELYVSPQIRRITELNVPHMVIYRNHSAPKRLDTHQWPVVAAGGNHHAMATLTEQGPVYRMLKLRELARIQGFSDTYEFHGNYDRRRAQIGNAVPVSLAKFIGQRVNKALGITPALDQELGVAA